MNLLRPFALAALLLLGGGAQARAQAPPAAPELGASKVVDELVVVKRLPGPAIWKAAKPDSELFILGAVTPLPHLQAWDETRVGNAVQDAVVVLLPPDAKVGIFDMIGLKITGGGTRLGGGKTLDKVLAPPLLARAKRAATIARSDWKRYEHLKPAFAGVALLADWRKAAGLSEAKPGSTVDRLAKEHGTPARVVSTFNVSPMLKAAQGLSDAAQQACLVDAMDEFDYEVANTIPAAKAWAEGDLAGVRAHYQPNRVEHCLQAAPSVAALLERATADTTTELKKVLDRPGKTVAVVDLALLLRANGVLDRLKADGAQISVPNR